MRGRPKLPTEIKKLQGTEDKRWLIENEMKVVPMDVLPEAPKTFNDATIKIWDDVCRELKRNGLLASCDLELLRGYCILLNQFEQAHAMTKTEGLVVVSRLGEQVINPWYKIQCDSLKQATQIGQLFGITPSARSKISTAATKPVSKLDSLKKPKTA